MAIQSFSVGQVLTAAQVNALQANDYNQTVNAKTASYTLVATDKGTRITMSSTSATTITVNTSLFSAGDTLFIQNLNSGVSTITAGTATVTTASSLALAQWEGGTLYFTSASAAIFFKSDGAAAGGGGKVLQVVSTTKDNTFATTSTSFTDVTGLSVTITPTSATSKILVMLTAQISGGDTGRSLRGRLMRGATAIAVGTSGRTYMSRPTNPDEINSMAVTFLDSPATTSATTYNTQILSTNGSLNVFVNRSENSEDAYFSTITVIEIGA